MKKLIALLMIMAPTCALAAPPQCINIGSRSEGWQMPDGHLIKTQCKSQVAFCDAIGTKSEGWYAASVAESRLIIYDNCTTGTIPRPRCVNIGTKSEGWQIDNAPIIYDQCAKKIAACVDGSRSEGWYGVTIKGPKRRLQWAKCAAGR